MGEAQQSKGGSSSDSLGNDRFQRGRDDRSSRQVIDIDFIASVVGIVILTALAVWSYLEWIGDQS